MRRFHDEYRRLRSRVAEVRRIVHQIRAGRADGSSRATDVLRLFTHEILPHARWTEQIIYPLAEADPFRADVSTLLSTLRRENARLSRLVSELRDLESYRGAGFRAFAVLAIELAGLADRHLVDERMALAPTIQRLEVLMHPDQGPGLRN
jgi:hypothetical protein